MYDFRDINSIKTSPLTSFAYILNKKGVSFYFYVYMDYNVFLNHKMYFFFFSAILAILSLCVLFLLV